jgi:hypothetical protein
MVVEARSGAPVAGAEITIVGSRGAVRTDGAGRFQWPIAPLLPGDVIAVLADGRVARPIRITTIAGKESLNLRVEGSIPSRLTTRSKELTSKS